MQQRRLQEIKTEQKEERCDMTNEMKESGKQSKAQEINKFQ